MEKHFGVLSRVWLLSAIITTAMSALSVARADELGQILRGFEIAPVPLNLAGKDWKLVGLGSYIVNTTGCNDCHTHGYLQLEGKVPETDWLSGESTGWVGPWGTTYAINLRLFLENLPEDAWVQFSRAARSRPAMPWWVLREMKEEDLRAIFLFIKNLGPKGVNAPGYLPPNQKPKPPYFEFVP